MRKPSLRALSVTTAAAVVVGAGVVLANAQAAPMRCQATYAVGAQWQGGFIGTIAVRNLGDPVSTWRLTWTFGQGQRVVQAWGAKATQAGAQVTATNASWNATLREGSSAVIGFVAVGSGPASTPSTVALNGVTCGLSTPGAPPGPSSGPAPVTPSAPVPSSGPAPVTPSAPAPVTPSAPVPSSGPAPVTPPSSVPVTSTTSASGANSSQSADADCDEPTPLPAPPKRVVVGLGTAETCTESALRTAASGGGYVTFNCGGGAVTIPVKAEIKTTATTVIDGEGKITLKGGGRNRILLAANGTTLSVRNLRFVNGAAAQVEDRGAGAGGAVSGIYKTNIEVIGSTFENNSAGFGGGAVYVGTDGKLSIARSAFTGNSSWYGGAVYSLLAPLTVVNSTFTDNSTLAKPGAGDGGAIGTDGAAPLTANRTGGQIRICGSTFTRNKSARGSGGGVYLWAYAGDRIVVDRSTFKENAIDGIGGGARVSIGPTDWGKTGSITISDTSILSNTSTGNGGGLYLDCAPTCTIQNTTLYRNSSKAYGGAIFGDGHHDNNVTFAENSAGGHGGALFGGKFVLNNTVFVGNKAGNPWGQAMSCSQTGTGAHVVEWLTSSADKVSKCIPGVRAVDPQLQKPADNGGPTLTMMPAATSPLLKAGSGCTPRDQRGVARKSPACDVGAVERS
jgi:predicted outer membrane repeat protein